ncbi:MAG TPA: thermonuclease family protein [Ramlibacter sp.]|nr:thermonuclease family protein [Ramlibacter sp.]
MTELFRALAICLLIASGAAAQARTSQGVVSHVTDGDTLWVRPLGGGAPYAVRLEGIDAPEICQAWGERSRDALAARALHQRVKVASRRTDEYQRALGRVSVDGEDLGLWMVRHGHAWSYRFRGNHGPYAQQENQARDLHLGLWRTVRPTPPREFRARHGSCH